MMNKLIVMGMRQWPEKEFRKHILYPRLTASNKLLALSLLIVFIATDGIAQASNIQAFKDPGAIYHVMNQGDRREPICHDVWREFIAA
jgi:hypothetical protein